MSVAMPFVCDDGGRRSAGYAAPARDCVARAVAIATGRPYEEVYARLADGHAAQRIMLRSKGSHHGIRTADHGIFVQRKWFRDYMEELGFVWKPTMGIGTGCRVHLAACELPQGRLVVSVSRHLAAVINGVLHDTRDSSRFGTRCVYGYWTLNGIEALTGDTTKEVKHD